MAEIGLVASIIGVIRLSEAVVKEAYKYGKAVKSAEKDMRDLERDVNGLIDTLKKLKDLAQKAADSGNPPDLWPALSSLEKDESPLHACESSLTSLLPEIVPKGKFAKHKAHAFWPHTQKKVKQAVHAIITQKEELLDALSIDHAGQTLDDAHMIKNINETQTAIQNVSCSTYNQMTKERKGAIVRWLTSTDASQNYVDALDKRSESTGGWLLNNSKYTSWKKCTGRHLWIHGPSGCGKTVLCSSVVQDITTARKPEGPFLLAYYFFDITDRAKQTLSNFISSILGQICAQLSSVPDCVEELYMHYGQGGSGNRPREALKDTLLTLLASIDHFYLCIDALDECSERHEFFAFLKQIHNTRAQKVQILVTSQNQNSIEKALENLAVDSLDVRDSPNDFDIRNYVRENFNPSGKLEMWANHPIGSDIETKLCEGAQGSYV